ncbi:hypothetical protein SHIRM173S_09006 [Streptomyces hirsutus]
MAPGWNSGSLAGSVLVSAAGSSSRIVSPRSRGSEPSARASCSVTTCGPAAEVRSTTAPPPSSEPDQVTEETSRFSFSTSEGTSSTWAVAWNTWSQSPSHSQVFSGLRNSTSSPSGSHAAPWARHCARAPPSSGSSPVPAAFVTRSRGTLCPSTVVVAVYAIQSRFSSSFTGFHTGSPAVPFAGEVTRVAVPPFRGRT